MSLRRYTQRGRVVYDRPRNHFRWSDVDRIVRSLDVPTIFDGARRYAQFLGVAGRIWAKIAASGARGARDALLEAFLPREVTSLGRAIDVLRSTKDELERLVEGSIGGARAFGLRTRLDPIDPDERDVEDEGGAPVQGPGSPVQANIRILDQALRSAREALEGYGDS